MKEKSALVVAHPDDEILWFSSIVKQVDEIIICFLEHPSKPEWTAGRKKALSGFPLSNVTVLEVPCAEVFNHADWNAPLETEFGLQLTKSDIHSKRYQSNYNVLKSGLEKKLQNFTKVYTHNPWGEYAHEEHVQVFRVVATLKLVLGFNVWFSNYFSNRSHSLMMRNIGRIASVSRLMNTDIEISQKIMDLYMASGCWTWFEDWEWPRTEFFFLEGTNTEKRVTKPRLLPLQMVDVPPVNVVEKKQNAIAKLTVRMKQKLKLKPFK